MSEMDHLQTNYPAMLLMTITFLLLVPLLRKKQLHCAVCSRLCVCSRFCFFLRQSGERPCLTIRFFFPFPATFYIFLPRGGGLCGPRVKVISAFFFCSTLFIGNSFFFNIYRARLRLGSEMNSSVGRGFLLDWPSDGPPPSNHHKECLWTHTHTR